MGVIAPARGQVVLNEVCASNGGGALSPGGTTPDYIELINVTNVAVSLNGWTLTDNIEIDDKYEFPSSASIPVGGRLILWLDDPTFPGLATTNFTLKGTGEEVALFNDGTLIDHLQFGPQIADLPISRMPDGSGAWMLSQPTPNAANIALPPSAFGVPAALRLNEWLATNSLGSKFDWLEIYNPSTNGIVDMAGLVITDAITNSPTTPAIPALSFIASGDRFQFWCDDVTNVADHLAIKLSSTSGETITIYEPDRATIIDRVTFGAQTGDVSMGRLPDGGPDFFYFPTTNNMSPGMANKWQSLTNVVINEVLTHTDLPLEDAIELFNPTATPIDISHWYISNEEEFPLKFRIPAGTVIPAFGFKVFYEQNQLNAASATPGFNRSGIGNAPDFTFNSAHGSDVVLTEGLASGSITGRRNVKEVDAAANGASFGRHVKSDGGADLVRMAARTFGSDAPSTVAQFRLGTGKTNAYPMVGPLVITEIMYRPPDMGTNDNSLDEYVELRTTTNGLLRLYDPNYPTNVWRMRGGIEYDFPTNVTMAANTRVLLVNFDPQTNLIQIAAFRSRYSVATNVPLYGPFRGKLNNDKDSLELQRPDSVQLPPKPDAGYVPRIIVDRVNYEDDSGWTDFADGTGYSLQRLVLGGYGNDHTNWYGAPTTAGAANAPGVPVAITTQPVSIVTTQGQTASFSTTVSGSAPFGYAWSGPGAYLYETDTPSLVLSDVQPTQAGPYQVIITNYFGSATSTVAMLTVLVPPLVITQPISVSLPPGDTATFVVGADGTAPINYQWRKNGTNLIGQTGSSLTLNNVQPGNAGTYDAVVQNGVGTATSAAAVLTIGGSAPAITTHPASQTAAAGATVQLSVIAAGSGPLGYQWRYNGIELPGERASTLTLAHVHPSQSGNYEVVVSNAFGLATSSPATVTIGQPPYILLPPTDQYVAAGDTVILLIIADGTPELTYQWRCNGTNLVGETSALLFLPGVQPSQGGSYTVVIANPYGFVVSDPIQLTVAGAPRLVMSPPAPDGRARLTLHGTVGQVYEVETTDTLWPPNWMLLSRFTLTNTQGAHLLSDDATNLTKRFYRGKQTQ